MVYPIPLVPEPLLRVVKNHTGFRHFQHDKMGPGRRFHDTVVVKGTFTLAEGRLERSGTQTQIELSDQWWDRGDPARSSLRCAGDVVLFKPSTDVIVCGTARAPGRAPVPSWSVGVVVTDRSSRSVLSYGARVTGERVWRSSRLLGWSLSEPVPTAAVPLRYELAYGGSYVRSDGSRSTHEPNPSGRGHLDLRARHVDEPIDAPQWEHPAAPIGPPGQPVPVAGLGPVARPWASRYQFAGTYDDAWRTVSLARRRQGQPLDYPSDFDPRFFQCAAPALIAPRYLEGDERIGLVNLAADRPGFSFELPGVDVSAELLDVAKRWTRQPLPLDTVTVDLDAEQVTLLWRLSLPRARRVIAAVLHTPEA